MCGLAGFIDYTKDSSKDVLIKMTDSMVNRGPDGYGYDLLQKESCQIGLGHRRLSIQDLSNLGRQPMYAFENRYAIVFNGEVYNFKEIAYWLEEKGYQLTSSSDTEVILLALIEEGIEAVKRFIGMFAIAFFDFDKGEMTLIRDRAGVKPLFYQQNSKSLLFASETRAFHCHPHFDKSLNASAMAEYFDFGYVKTQGSIFQQVEMVDPGTYVKYNFNSKEIEKHRYWSIYDYYKKSTLRISFNEAEEHLESLLIDAFKLRMVSDVPVGVFLSGGVDSSTVAALLQAHSGQQISTYTIGFEDKSFNEAQRAKEIAAHIGTDHHELYCSESELLNIFPRLPEIFDEPFADHSAIPTTLVSEFAKKNVTVALSADGGDEVFAGYNKYYKILDHLKFFESKNIEIEKFFWGLIYNKFSKAIGTQSKVISKAYSELKLLNFSDLPVEMMVSASRVFGKRDLGYMIGEDIPYTSTGASSLKLGDNLSDLQAYDFGDYLPFDILTKVDRATMSISLEGREPLLDHRIVEFAAQLPLSFKYDGKSRKKILRSINSRYISSDLIDKTKRGFTIPKKKWLEAHLKPYIEDYLNEGRIKENGVLDVKYIKELKRTFNKGIGHNRIWNVLLFNMWYEKWMK